MKNKRYDARTDANQKDIIAVLNQLGYAVLDLSPIGGGCPDIAIVKDDFLFEIKTEKGKLNDKQKKWHTEWRGPKPHVVRNVWEIIEVIEKRSVDRKVKEWMKLDKPKEISTQNT